MAGLRQTALEQVHQQEGQIVKHVAGGDDVAELDGVEQHRLAVDQHDIAEMEIAVDVADKAVPAALAQQRYDALVARRGLAFARTGLVLQSAGGKIFRMFAERLDVFVDIRAERFDPRLRLDRLVLGMGRGDGAAERIGELVVDLCRRCDRACAFSSKRRMSTAHSTGLPLPPIARLPSRSRVMATTPR